MAQEARSKRMASSKLRRILNRNRTFEITSIAVGDSATFLQTDKSQGRPGMAGPGRHLGYRRGWRDGQNSERNFQDCAFLRSEMFGDLAWHTCLKLESGGTVARRKIGEDPLDAEVPLEQGTVTTEVPAGVPVKEPTPNGRNPWRRMSGCGEVSGMTADVRTHAPPPAGAALGCTHA